MNHISAYTHVYTLYPEFYFEWNCEMKVGDTSKLWALYPKIFQYTVKVRNCWNYVSFFVYRQVEYTIILYINYSIFIGVGGNS